MERGSPCEDGGASDLEINQITQKRKMMMGLSLALPHTKTELKTRIKEGDYLERER